MLHPHFKEIRVLSISIFAQELNSHPCPELLACTVLTHSSVYPLNNRTISPVTNQSLLHPFVSLTSRSLLLVQYCETPTGLWRLGFTGRTSRTVLSVRTSKHRCHFVDHHRLSSQSQPVQQTPAALDLDEESQFQLALSLSKEEHQQVWSFWGKNSILFSRLSC